MYFSTGPYVDNKNRLPAIGNDSQNCIHCCWRAAIIYELNKNIVVVKNNIV